MIGGMDEALHSKDVARPASPAGSANSVRPASPALSGGAEYPEFPGCHPVRISRDEIRSWEGRIEFWDADTEIAMVCEPTSLYHEAPGHRLAQLAERIAAVRGSPIRAGGASDLLLRNERREWWRIMQADQMLFLNRQEFESAGPSVEVGLNRLPDVVLEVDNTTDVRRGKLGLYEAWGFPEVWVEVPEQPSPSRPASLRPGLTIHLASEGGFRDSPVSGAFPGWTAAEIHTALNEPVLSVETVAALRRVGRAMGESVGTGPEDDLWLREERAEGQAKGRAEGRAEGQADMLRATVREVLESRGLSVTPAIVEQLSRHGLDSATAIRAALACRSEEDFVRRLRPVETAGPA